jgi:hypothetical protein
MMVKSAQPGVGWGVYAPPPFNVSNIPSKVVVYASAEGVRNTPNISTVPLYVLCGVASSYKILRLADQ